MEHALLSLLVLVIVLGIVYFILKLIIDLLPMDGNFKQIAQLILIGVIAIILLVRALPLIGMSI